MKLRNLLVFLFALTCSVRLFAIPLHLKATVNSSLTHITISIDAEDVTRASYDTNEKIWENLAITLEGYETNQRDRLPDNPGKHRFIWTSLADPVRQDTADDKMSLQLSLSLINNPDATDTSKTIKSLFEGKQSLALKVTFAGTSKDGAVAMVFGRPNAAPTGLDATSSHFGLTAHWKGNTEVEYTKGGKQVPSNTLMLLFEEGDSNIDVKATRIDENQDTKDEKTSSITCKFESGEDCIRCDEAQGKPVFLNSSQGSDKNFQFALAGNSKDSGSYGFQNLDPDKTYILVAQYDEGLHRSGCIQVKAGRTLSLTEANSEEASKDFKDVRCFIATAAYGSPFHSYVEDFRWFRGAYLLKTSLGKRLVAFYYENSPEYAAIIAESATLRSVARGILFLPAMGVAGLRYAHNHSWVIWLSLILTAAAVAVLMRKRRVKQCGQP